MTDLDTISIILDRLQKATAALERESIRRSECLAALAAAEDKLAAVVSAPKSEDVFSLLSALRDNRKIEAIKHLRTLTGLGLKESKDEIEAVYDRLRTPTAA